MIHDVILSERSQNREQDTRITVVLPDYYTDGTAHGVIHLETRLTPENTLRVEVTVHGSHMRRANGQPMSGIDPYCQAGWEFTASGLYIPPRMYKGYQNGR